MKSVFNFLWISLMLFCAPSALAQNKVGNGGDVVFCKADEKIESKASAALLDFYESNQRITADGSDPAAIAAAQFSKLDKVAPKLAFQYQNRLKQIQKEIEIKSEVQLTDIKDSNHLYQPLTKDCEILQIAIRKAKIAPGEKRFLIREDLWKQLSPTHQAGLLSHEIIYEHLAKLGDTDSIKTRKLNAYLYSGELKKDEFWKLIQSLDVPIYP